MEEVSQAFPAWKRPTGTCRICYKENIPSNSGLVWSRSSYLGSSDVTAHTTWKEGLGLGIWENMV